MKKILLLLVLFIVQVNTAQIATTSGITFAKEFSKEQSLYKAKAFVIQDVLGTSDNIVKFEIDPLAASSTGELTSLVYKCEDLNKEGLLLGFYGNYWNESGVIYQGYGFKNFPTNKALELMNKIQKVIEQTKYNDTNNIYFQYDDLTILIYSSTSALAIRVFWKTFDADWEYTAFKRTKRRFEKKIIE